MKITKIAGICLLIPVLLTGCGSKTDTQTTAASTSQPQQQQTEKAADGQQQNRPAMDPAQRQLFSTFQTLVMLDKADGLAITKEQAQAMLPVAQDIVTKKELTDENRTKLLASLTDAQKTFLTDAETRMGNRGTGGNGGPNGQGGQGRPNGGNGAAGQDQGQRQGQGQAPNTSAAPKAADGTGNAQQGGGNRPNANGGGGQNGGGGFGGNRPGGGQMANIGEQFIELLQTKLK